MADTPCPDQPWGTIATDVPDPPTCISDCRARFLRLLLPDNETFERVCKILSDENNEEKDQLFWALYCCDSQLCGVDNLWEGGQDPNANWLINSCQNIGHYSVLDPGPPDAAYVCSRKNNLKQDITCPSQALLSPTVDVGSLETPWVTLEELGVTEAPTKTTPTPIPSRTHGSFSFSTYSSIQDPSLAVNIDLSEAKDKYNQGNNTPTRIKVTIVLATLAGVALIFTLVLCLLRSRRRTSARGSNSSSQTKYHNASRPGSPAAPVKMDYLLAGPGDMMVALPPPRLQNRRYLSSLPTVTRPQPSRPRLSSLRGVQSPCHPLLDHNIMANGSASVPIGPASPPNVLAPGTPEACKLRTESPDSYTSTLNRPSLLSWTATLPARGSVGTGTWPLRRHRTKEYAGSSLPGSPGPPPDRALPSTPPRSPIAVAKTKDGIGVAVGHSPSHSSIQSMVLSQETRDLCDLTEACANEMRHSWGSWGCAGGGGPGVAILSPKKGSSDISSPLLEEVDLEKMGGSY